MTDLEIMIHAKKYMDKLAHGINPLTDEPVPEEELINHVRISRCFFYVSDVLRRVIEKGGLEAMERPKNPDLPPFRIAYEELSRFDFSDRPITISRIAERINALVDTTQMKKLSYSVIRKWLMQGGMMEETTLSDGKKRTLPTQQGRQMGITTQPRLSPYGKEYEVVVYDRQAQQFIVDNLPDMIGKENDESHDTQSGKSDGY